MKTNKWIYWIATTMLSLQMVATGFGDIVQAEPMVESVTGLGFPQYVLPLFGVLKIAGILTILFIKNSHLKIGAYAGFSFYGVGAVYSHLAHGDTIFLVLPALLIVILTASSYFGWIKKTTSAKNETVFSISHG